jgi:transposase-like protein
MHMWDSSGLATRCNKVYPSTFPHQNNLIFGKINYFSEGGFVMPARRYTETEISKIVNEYASGKSSKELAQKFDISIPTVCGYVNKYGKGTRRPGAIGKLSKKEHQEIVRLYFSEGLSSVDIAMQYDVHPVTIRNAIRRAGQECRSNSEAHQTNSIDENYFNEINREGQAYWLGFLMADGCVYIPKAGSAVLKVYMAITDYKHLNKFLASIKSNHSITMRRKNGIKIGAGIAIQNKSITDDLIRHGCVPRKTFKLSYPKNIPESLTNHFVRGYFDGDGCLSKRSNRSEWSIDIAGAYRFLRDMQNMFCINRLAKKKEPRKQKGIYMLSYAGNIQVKRIMDWMYDNSTIYLDRKYQKYKELTSFILGRQGGCK